MLSFWYRSIIALEGSSLTPASFRGDATLEANMGATGDNGFKELIGAMGAIGVLAVSGVIGVTDVLGTTEVIGDIGLYWGAAPANAIIAKRLTH